MCCILDWRRKQLVFPFLIWRLNGCKITSFSRKVCDFRWLIGRTQIELTQNVTSFHSPQFEITQILAWKAKPINSPRSGNHISRCRKILAIKGNPTMIFCKIAVRRSKYCLEFSITWGRLKISRWSFHLRTIFDTLIPYDFLKFNFPTLLPRLGLFFLQNRKPKIFGFENVMERGTRKILTFTMR